VRDQAVLEGNILREGRDQSGRVGYGLPRWITLPLGGNGGKIVSSSYTSGSPSHAGSVLSLLLRQSKLLGVTLPRREEPLTS